MLLSVNAIYSYFHVRFIQINILLLLFPRFEIQLELWHNFTDVVGPSGQWFVCLFSFIPWSKSYLAFLNRFGNTLANNLINIYILHLSTREI